MKGIFNFLLVSASLILVMTSCAKKCDDFDNKIIDWMPYKTNDKIVVSQNGDMDTLNVNYSEIYHTDKIAFGVKCACEDSFILNLSSESLHIDIRFNDSRQIEQSDIVINDVWLEYSEHLDALVINGKSYSDLIIYKSNIASSRYEKIIVVKSIGIVSIIGDREEWTITDDALKQIEISDIEFMGVDC